MTQQSTLWHVTSFELAEIITSDGFLGGWGDAGFGIYLFDDLAVAQDYAANNGWDGSLIDPAILEVQAPSREIQPVIPDPEWPNPEDYKNVFWAQMNPDQDDITWRPDRKII
jgi:hypothetical protein